MDDVNDDVNVTALPSADGENKGGDDGDDDSANNNSDDDDNNESDDSSDGGSGSGGDSDDNDDAAAGATDADNSATDADNDNSATDANSDGDDEGDDSDDSNSSDEDFDDIKLPEQKEEKKEEAVKKKKGGFFSRLVGKKAEVISSSSSEESEDSIDFDVIDAETIENAIECLKMVEEVDSDWDILLDAPSDWDSDDSENKPTAPVFRSTCGTLTMETTQLREDLLNDLLESRVHLVEAEKELKVTEEDQYMMYYFDTLSKLRSTRDKAAARVQDEEARLAMYSQQDEGVTRLASALRFNEHLISLTLCNAEITVAGAISLASAVKVHPTLTHLSLKHNPIGAEGAEALFRASRRNGVGGLHELDLWDCNIGPNGALMIATQLYADTSLREVRLRYNQFGPVGGFAFASCLMQNRTIEKLDLSVNDIGMRGALAFERVLKYSVVVDMEENTMLKPFKKVCKLCKSRIDNPFWDDVNKQQVAAAAKAVKKAAKEKALAEGASKNESKGGETKGGGDDEGEGGEGSEGGGGGGKEGEEDEENDSDDSDDLEKQQDDTAGEGESKTGERTRMFGAARARRKRLKLEAERKKRIAANTKFWMNSYVTTKEDLEQQKELMFSFQTKKRTHNLVLFAGTRLQCTKAIDLMDNDSLGLTMAQPNMIVKEIDLENNSLERPFRNNIPMMKRLFGSRLKGVWQPVENFFKPTLRS